ncbi:MAG TPA: GMC family oxidoreductase N-terminal domain-containing protein, partial [Roseiflexaceae bacterium]|nr:GMC family oxidoreductase N-terminal domain-containing protein [Roseiflexaceae bacterium]
MPQTLTPKERHLRTALRTFAVLFALAIVAYVLPALIGPARAYWVQLPFVGNSAVKVALLGMLCAVAGADVRRFSSLVPVIIAGHAVSILASIALLIWADTSTVFPIFGMSISAAMLLWGAIVLDAAILALFTLLYDKAQRERYGLRYLSVYEFQTIVALSEVLIDSDERKIAPEQIGRNVDDYLATFTARRKWVINLALLGLHFYPMLSLRVPFPAMAPDERLRFVKARFERDVVDRRILDLWRMLTQAMIRVAQQLAYLGYYGDERTFESVGYVPFTKRARFEEAMIHVEKNRPRVTAQTPHQIDGDTINADVVIVGSGAGGAVLGYRLAEAGRQVLMLERGRHVDPSEFSENEIDMFTKLYADGALQLSRDFRLQVLQGQCVGGTTVVNNAVCFDLPEPVLQRWNDVHEAGLDEARLRESFAAMRCWLHIRRQPNLFLHPGARKFVDGIDRLGLGAAPNNFGIVEANIADCIGCGYCNIGCAYGKKLSMLDTILPWAQQKFGPDGLRILAECEVERIVAGGGRARSLECKLSDGRKLRVNANTVVVSAGAVASSWLLMNSNLGGKMVGQHLHFNMGSPITADFDEALHSYDGLQISHYFEPPAGSGYVMETWFNPVVSQALAMPGWFEDHFKNMRRYANLTATGVLVGTQNGGRVDRALTGGPDIDFTP